MSQSQTHTFTQTHHKKHYESVPNTHTHFTHRHTIRNTMSQSQTHDTFTHTFHTGTP